MIVKGTCIKCKEEKHVIDTISICEQCIFEARHSKNVSPETKDALKWLVNVQYGAVLPGFVPFKDFEHEPRTFLDVVSDLDGFENEDGAKVKEPPAKKAGAEPRTFDVSSDYPKFLHVFGDVLSFDRAFTYAPGAARMATESARIVVDAFKEGAEHEDVKRARSKQRKCPQCGVNMDFALFFMRNRDRDKKALAMLWNDDRVELRCCRCYEGMLQKM